MGIEEAIDGIRKKHGNESIWRMSDRPIEAIDVIPSGNIAIDIALGVGGYPRGRIIEIYGQEASGKTTLCLHAIAEAQRLGGQCAFIDAEHALDPQYAQAIGVDVNSLLVSQPDNGEQALGIAYDLIKSESIQLIVVDSVAALVPLAEIQGDIGEAHVGRQARLMSSSLRMMTPSADKFGTTVMFINQLREKIGVMFGSPITTTGGKALKFYASVRIDIARKEQIKNGTEVIGNKTLVKIVKNKLAPPFTIAEFDIDYGEGMSQAGSLIDLGVEFKILTKKAAWYYWNEHQIGQGKPQTKQFFKDNPEKMEELYSLIMRELRTE